MQDGNRRQSRQPDRGGRRKRSKAPAERAGIRLAHYLAMAGVSSRRKCEEYITSGRTTVDGEVVKDFSFRVEPTSSDVRIDGERVRLPPRVYFMINKPPGVICTNRDPAGRTRVIDLFPPMRERLFTVGRLDENSEGMLIVTNDGDLAHQLAHPRFRIPKYYKVHVAGVPDESDLAQLRKGMRFAEGWFKVENVRLLKDLKRSALLSVVLSEGQNREIRRLLARLDHKVLRLKRVGMGTVRLGETPLGAYRALTSNEIASLWELIRSPRPVAKRPARDAASSRSANSASETVQSPAGSSTSSGHEDDLGAPRGRQPRHKPLAPGASPTAVPPHRSRRGPASAAQHVPDESVEEYDDPLFDDEDLDDDDRHDFERGADAEAFDESNADTSANADFDEELDAADLDVMEDDFDDEELFDADPSAMEDDGESNERGAKGRSRRRDAIDFSQEEPADESPRPARSGWKFERRPPRPTGPSRQSRAARPSSDAADEAETERRPRGRRGAPAAPGVPSGAKPGRRPSRGGKPRRTAGSSTGEVQSFAEGTTPPSRRRGRHAGGRRPQRAGTGTPGDEAASGPSRRPFGGRPGAGGKRPPRPARHRDVEHAASETDAEPSPGPKRGGGRPHTGRTQSRPPQTDRPPTGRRRPPRDRGDDAQGSTNGAGRAAEGGGPAGGAARSQRPRRQKPKRRRNRD